MSVTGAFTRATAAYKANGELVRAKVPRFEPGRFGQALLVEEGTTNLISQKGGSALYNPRPSWLNADAEVVADSNCPFGGYAAKLDATTNGSYEDLGGVSWTAADGLAGGNVFYLSFYAKWNNRITSDNRLWYTDGTYTAFAEEWVVNPNPDPNVYQKYVMKYTIPQPTEGKTINYIALTPWFYFNTDNASIGYISPVMAEKKAYPTSFIDGTRAAERLTLPTAGVLSAQEGTIEFAVKLDTLKSGATGSQVYSAMFTSGNVAVPGPRILIMRDYVDNKITIWDGDGSTESVLKDTDAMVAGTWCHVAFTWSPSGRKLFVNGVLKASNTRTNNLGYASTAEIGTWYAPGTEDHLDGLIDDLRISNRYRTDQEILDAYNSNQPLQRDQYTTCLLPFDGAIRDKTADFTVTDQSPSAGYIAWKDLNIRYRDIDYSIADGNTNLMYIWWDWDDPFVLQTSNTLPALDDEDLVVFVNKNGIHFTVPTTTVIDGSLVVSESIQAGAMAAKSILAGNIAAGAVGAQEIAAGVITADKLSVLDPFLQAGTVTNNSPSAGYVAWSGVQIVKEGTVYTPTNGNSNNAVIWWDKSANQVKGSPHGSESVPGTFEYEWNGAEDVLIGLNVAGTFDRVWTGTAIVGGQIHTDAITTRHVAADSIEANHLKAGSIHVDHLAVGSYTDNMILNPSFEQGLNGWTLAEGTGTFAQTVLADAPEGDCALGLAPDGDHGVGGLAVPIVPGDTYILRCKVKHTNGTGVWNVHLDWRSDYPSSGYVNISNRAGYLQKGNAAPPTTWTTYELVFTPPANAYWGSLVFYNWGSSTGTLYVDEVEFRKQLGSAHITDAAITNAKIANVDAGKITTGTLNADRLAAASITATKLNIKQLILVNDSWTNNSPSSGYVAWNAHTLYWNGSAYNITGGNTANRFIYWVNGNTTYSTSATYPTLGATDFLIATNNNGIFDLAWNKLANLAVGEPTLADTAVVDRTISEGAVSLDRLASGGAKIPSPVWEETFIPLGYFPTGSSGTIDGFRHLISPDSVFVSTWPNYDIEAYLETNVQQGSVTLSLMDFTANQVITSVSTGSPVGFLRSADVGGYFLKLTRPSLIGARFTGSSSGGCSPVLVIRLLPLL